jgi:hypothetical protein
VTSLTENVARFLPFQKGRTTNYQSENQLLKPGYKGKEVLIDLCPLKI